MELVFNWDRISVWGDEDSWVKGSGGGCTILTLKKISNFMFMYTVPQFGS